jgi:tetratricopeptide (TPR) repeat protein
MAPYADVPASLQDSLMARLDRLPTAKPVAQTAAALGRDFSRQMLQPICDLSPREVDQALEELVGAGVLVPRGGSSTPWYVFKHALVQDAAYNSLLRERRRQLHRRIAEALGAHLADQPALLAHHWECAADLDNALKYRLQAGQRAAARSAVWEAVSQYWRALELLQQLPESEDKWQNHLAIQLKLLSLKGGDYWQNAANLSRALRHIDKAVAIASDDGDAAALAHLKAYKGHKLQDETLLVEATRHASDSRDLAAMAAVDETCAVYYGLCGRFQESVDHVERAVAIYGDLGMDLQQGMVMASPGRCHSARAGRLERSFHYAARARAIANATGDLRLRSWLTMEAEVYFYKGLWQLAVDVAEKELPAAWEIGSWTAILWCSGWAAIAEIKLGHRRAARARIEAALRKAGPRCLDFFSQAYPRIALGHALLAEGEVEAALEAARQASEMAGQRGARLELGAAHRLLAQIHEARGDRQESEVEHRCSLDILGAIESRPELAQSLLAYGRFKRAHDAGEGQQLLGRALTLF